MQDLVTKNNLTRDKIADSLSSFVDMTDRKLDYVAAFLDMTTITLEVPDELAGRLASLQTHLPQLLTFPMRRVHGSADLLATRHFGLGH